MSLNKKVLGEETKKARITPPVRRVNKNVQPSFFMDSTSLLPENFAQPMPPMYEEGGDVKRPGDGWEYKQAGEEFLTRRQGGTDWITAKGAARDAIQSKVFAQPQITATPTSPLEIAQIKNELKSYDPQKTGNADYTKNIQRKLVNAGYDLGGYGDGGVDGVFGDATKKALESFNSGISPEFAPAYIRPTKKTRETKITKDPKAYSKFTIAKNLEPGILPTLYSGTGTEGCVEGQQCSANASIKMGNLLGDAAEGGTGALWGKNAWFQKDYLLNNGGDLLYETGERNVGLMAQVPPETYANYQVGDHVQLNRADTPSSKKYAAETSEYKNENIEHQGFIIGKTSDGTPLIWHGSEDGTAYIQRMDEDLFLNTSHGKLNYKIASIVRGSAMKNADKDKLRALQNSSYYSPINEDNILVPNKNASLKQKQMAEVVNSSIGEFKSLGYNQDDLTYVSQLLVGGIMDNETSSGESMKAYPKEVIAVMAKNVMGLGSTEASRGVYQLKPEMNFKNKDGELNKMGKELEKMGVSFNDIASSSEAQTKAGALMMLNYYANLKKDPDFDVETNLYKGKVPASYLLAKSWQQGGGWYKKEKFSDLINNLDVDYSWSALEGAVDNIAVGDKQKDIKAELRAAKQVKEAQDKARYEKERVDYFNSAEGQAAYARQQEKDKAEAEWAKYNSPSSIFYQQPAESTSLNVNTAPMPQFKRPKLFDEGGPVHSHPHGRGEKKVHPNVRRLTDQDYLEDYVNRAQKSRGIVGGSGDNAYEKKAMMGNIPIRFDESGKAYSPSDKYGGFGYRQKGVGNTNYYPVNWEQYLYDQDDGVKQQFIKPTEVKAKASNYQKKLHKLPKEERKVIVDRMNTLEEMYRQQNGIPAGTETGVSRADIYKAAKSNKEAIKASKEYRKGKTDYINATQGTIKQGKETKKAGFLDKVGDVAAHPFDFFQASMGSGNASDLWDQNGGRSWNDTREMYKQAGVDPTINGRQTSMVGNALNVWNPSRLASDTEYNLDAKRYGDIAWDLAEVASPAIGKYTGKAAKYVGGKLAPYYDKAFASTKYLDKGITGLTKSAPKLQKNLLKASKHANLNNMGFATSVGAEIPLINRFAEDPNWTNAGMLAYNTWGLVPGVGYSKKIAQSGKRYVDDVVGATKSAGKFQLPKYKNVYRAEPTGYKQASNAKDVTGRWFANSPAETQFYVKNLKSADPNSKIRIMRNRLPEHQINQKFGSGMPEEARIMSQGRGTMTNNQLEEVLGPGANQRFQQGRFTSQDRAGLSTHPELFNPNEGVLNASTVNNMRNAKPADFNPFARSRARTFDDKGTATEHLFDLQNKVNKPGLGQYLPFSFRKQGGSVNQYKKGGQPIWQGLLDKP